MKILNSNAYPIVSVYESKQKFLLSSQVADTFVGRNNVPNFKGLEKDVAKKILDNPAMLDKLGSDIGTLCSSAFENVSESIKNSPFGLKALFSACATAVLSLANKAYSEDNEIMEEAISDIEQPDSILAETVVIRNEIKSEDDEKNTVVENNVKNPKQFEFPKKWGKMSQSQQDLKELLESIVIPHNAKENLTKICESLLKKGEHKYGPEMRDCKDLLNNFYNEINKIKTDENLLEGYINQVHHLMFDEEDISDITEIPVKEIEENEIIYKTDTETTKLETPKVVGKIDLMEIKPKKKHPRKIIESESSEIDNKPLRFQYPAGAVNKKMGLLIFDLMSKFKKDANPTKSSEINFALAFPVSEVVTPAAIKTEVKNVAKRGSEHKFVNINSTNVDEVASAINSDNRFKEYFTLHAAMRFIDRYADFNANEPLEEQTKDMLDKLEGLLRKCFVDGVDMHNYKNSKGKLCPSITILPEKFNDEERKLFAEYPIKIAFANIHKKAWKDDIGALISTIYFPS